MKWVAYVRIQPRQVSDNVFITKAIPIIIIDSVSVEVLCKHTENNYN